MTEEEKLSPEEQAEKDKLLLEYRQSLYQMTQSGLPDPNILELILTEDYSKLETRYGFPEEEAKKLNKTINSSKQSLKVTPKLARQKMTLLYAYANDGLLIRISNQLAELLQFHSQNTQMNQKLVADVNQINNRLKESDGRTILDDVHESQVEEKKTKKKKKKTPKKKVA